MSSGKGSIHLEIPFDIGHASSLHKAGCLSVDIENKVFRILDRFYLDIGFQLDQRCGYSSERNNIIDPNREDLVDGLVAFKGNT